MNEFESDWNSLSQNFVQNVFAESKMAEFKMVAIIKLSQIELVWVRFKVEEKCFLVNLREDNKVFESKMGIQDGRIQDGCHHQVESEWMSLSQIEIVWVRVLCKMAESKMARIQDGRIQDGCHHQFKWEWMSLSQIELVWVRVRVEWECFEWIWEKITRCLNPRWQCLNPRWQRSGCLPSSSWVRMNEWSFFVQIVGTNLGKCEWVWEEKLRWLNPRWPNSRWLPSSS